MPVYNYINETGVITVDAADIETQVQNEFKAIFGADLVVTPNTPQGMLIEAETLARIGVAENNAKLANQINPNLAGGVFLDSIMALTNPFSRLPAMQSLVFVNIAGVAGTVIPAGSLVSETGSGDDFQYYTPDELTIPLSGTLENLVFRSVDYGPIPCALNTLTNIVTPVLGWESVTNVTAAVLGRVRQSDSEARTYRRATIATQGASVAQAIISEVMRIGAVSSVSFLENTANTTQTVDGVSMVAKSIYVCVNDSSTADLGTRSEVAAEITGTAPITQTGTLAATTTVTGLSDTSVLAPGWGVEGTGIEPGTKIASIPNSTTIVLTVAASGTGAQSLTFSVIIPAGSQASSNGYIFQTLADVAIPAGGVLSPVLFQAVNTGQIPVPVNSLTVIVTPVTGWATVNNTITAAIGLPSPIAQAIVAKKSAGAAFNNGPGTHIETVVKVPYSNQLMTVLFDLAVPVPIVVLATVKILTSVQNATQAVQNAIVAYANGELDGVAGLTVGQAVSAFELAGAVMSTHPGIYVQSLYISISPASPTSSTEIPIGKYEIARITHGSIIVNVVQ